MRIKFKNVVQESTALLHLALARLTTAANRMSISWQRSADRLRRVFLINILTLNDPCTETVLALFCGFTEGGLNTY